MRQLSFATVTPARRGDVTIVAPFLFVLGVLVGATIGPALRPHAGVPAEAALAAATEPGPPVIAALRAPVMELSYPAEVLRVIDGDTFAAHVRVWPGLGVDTKVRLRDIDAAELHARCEAELAQAQAARMALERMLAEGGVSLSRVGLDKYAGRVDAAVATRSIADVSVALLKGGFARAYNGGRRGSWCRDGRQ